MSPAWAPLAEGTGFGLGNLPYGVAVGLDGPGDRRPRVVTRIGDAVLPVVDAVPEGLRHHVDGPSLDALLAAGPVT